MHANIAKIVPIGITIVATTTAWRETKSPKFATLEMLLASCDAEMVPSTPVEWLRGSWLLLEAVTCGIKAQKDSRNRECSVRRRSVGVRSKCHRLRNINCSI